MMRLLATLCCAIIMLKQTEGHGVLMDPPARNSMWRVKGFTNLPTNYDDNGLNCGGRHIMWEVLNGKCGVCGDSYEEIQPRRHEAGGKYATGRIGRTYVSGSKVTMRVNITANHKGHFEFRICPNNNPKVAVTQDCLDEYRLEDENGNVNISIGEKKGDIYITLQLPKDLTCTQCVVQWTYIAGNNWGTHRQETFKNCADVAITKTTQLGKLVLPSEMPSRKTTKTRTELKITRPIRHTTKEMVTVPAGSKMSCVSKNGRFSDICSENCENNQSQQSTVIFKYCEAFCICEEKLGTEDRVRASLNI